MNSRPQASQADSAFRELKSEKAVSKNETLTWRVQSGKIKTIDRTASTCQK